MTKKIIIFLTALVLFSAALFASKGVGANDLAMLSSAVFNRKKQQKFHWGVYVGAFTFNRPDDPFILSRYKKQLPYVKKLGVNIVRANYEGDFRNGKLWHNRVVNDAVVKNIKDLGVDLLMVIEPPFPDFFKNANYKIGYEWGSEIAKRYVGKIDYYQLSNELSGILVNPGKIDDRELSNDEKYAIAKKYLFGLADGIKKYDPNAKLVVTANWVGVDIIDKLWQDGLKFDVVGWNWFSDAGDDLTNVKYDGGVINIPKHFEYTHTEFWVVEANRQYGDYADPGGGKQAEYLKRFATKTLKSGLVNGFIVYTLFDSNAATEGKLDKNVKWGLIEDKINIAKNEWEPGRIKKAFYTYQKLIKTYPNGMN